MFKKISILILLIFLSCNLEKPTEFSDKALADKLYDLNDNIYSFEEVIRQFEGKRILIDIWASWCRDCIEGLPKIKDLQKEFPQVVFLFLSVDKRKNSWKRGVTYYKIKGEHYNLPKGMKEGDLVDFLNINWIPRYVIIDKNGKIVLFKATNVSDNNIKKVLGF